jgi:cytochrome c
LRTHLALLTAASLSLLTAACSKPAAAPEASADMATPTAAAAGEPSDNEKAKLLASLPAPYNTGDLENGKRKFAMCRSCHTINQGGPNMTGPNLYGVFGRKAGAVEGFAYSDAVKAAGFIWDADHLDKWLADPRGFMPGTKMSFMGLKEPKDRIDVIAYLKVETGYKPE